MIVIDSNGVKSSKLGEWNCHKGYVKRGYLKIHVAVDIRKKRILSLKVTSEQVHDGKVLLELVDDITIKQNKKVNTAIAIVAMKQQELQLLSFRDIQLAIDVRKISRCKKTNHYLRDKTVKMEKTDLAKWKDRIRYGQRWVVKTVFPFIKRMIVWEYDKGDGTESIIV